MAIPTFLVLFTFFSALFVVPAAMALIVMVFCLSRHKWQLPDNYWRNFTRYWPLLLAALLLSYLVVVLRFATPDWSTAFAIFNALVNNTYPPVVELDGQTWFLRYYAAWYMPPALLAKFLGNQLLVATMFVWTAIGIFIAMLLMFHGLKRHLWLALVVFLLFSGLDLVGAWLNNSWQQVHSYWLNYWAGGELFVMLSNLNILQYAPAHALAAFLSTGLYLYDRRMALQYSVLSATIIAMWSPFCAVGLLPLALYAAAKHGLRTVLTAQNLLAAPLLAIPIVLYLTQGTDDIVKMYVWQHVNFSWASFVLFCIFEFLLVLGILYYILKEDRGLIGLVAVFLTLLCIYKIGYYADLLARGSMPAIVIISVLMLKALRASSGRHRDALVAYLLIGALPVVVACIKAASTHMPATYRQATFKQQLDMRPSDNRNTFRSQHLVNVLAARHIGGLPLMRDLEAISNDKN